MLVDKMSKQQLTTPEVIERLAAKFPSPQFGFLTQVRNGTGAGATRTADAMAMSLWPSRGLHVYGFEVKVSRNDWLKELKQPEKADEIASYCHYWYMVFGSEEIFDMAEIPHKWGVIVPSGKGLKILKEAPFDEHAEDFDSLMLAGVFRNVAEHCIPKETIQRKLTEKYEAGKDWSKHELDRYKKDLSELYRKVEAFEKAAGVKITGWNVDGTPQEVGAALKAVLGGKKRVAEALEAVEKMKERAGNIVKFLDGEADKYEI